jgi:hypothetical protein
MSPYEWNVYASPTGEDDSWVLMDARTSENCRRGTTGDWSCYNGGIPFEFTTRRDETEAGFDSVVKVSVASGAILDLTRSATVLANVVVDCASAGTICGGALSESGTLTLANVAVIGDMHYIAYYTGNPSNTAVVVTAAPAPL